MHSSLTRPIPFFFTLAVAFFLSGSAFAEHRWQDLDIAFNELDAAVVHGELHVTYQIERHDWRELKRAHLTPRLNLYAPGRHGLSFSYVYAVELGERSATVVFPRRVTPHHGRRVELRLSGERGRTRIATTSYGSSCASRIRVAVHRPRHQGRQQADNSGVIQACSANTSWSGDFKECVAKGSKIRGGAVSAINACGAATSWSGDFKDCLDLAANLRRGRAKTIRACSTATSWSGDFKDCLRASSSYRTAVAAPAIRACSAATSWSGDFKACLSGASRFDVDAPQVVNACSATTSWSGDFKDCLNASRATGHGRPT